MATARYLTVRFLVLAVLLLVCGGQRLGAEGITAFPESHSTLTFIENGQTYMELKFGGWGPKWSWLGFSGSVVEADGKTVVTNSTTVKSSGAKVTLVATAVKSGPRQLTLDVELSTSRDTDLTGIIAGVTAGAGQFSKGKLTAESTDGKTKTVSMPVGRNVLGKKVKQLVMLDDSGRKTTLSFDTALGAGCDKDIRIVLAQSLKADKPVKARITIDLPSNLTYHTSGEKTPADDSTGWYTFKPGEDYVTPDEISLAGWLERPAGKHGRIVRKGNDLIYNHKPIKLWGLNVCYSSCAPDKKLADQRAGFYAKYGVNSVRLHKYADGPGWAGIQSASSFAEFDPDGLDRLDYFIAQLKTKGIYVKLSSTFGVKLGPADRKTVPYMNEFGKPKGGRNPRVATGHGSVFLSRELQDLQIRQIVNILKHKNRYTGLTYAKDPCVAVVELFNEDSALFYGTLGRLQKIPTLRKMAAERFCDWLQARYGSKDACLKAWGSGGLNCYAAEGFRNESWEKKTIAPAGNPWFWDPAQLAGSQKAKRRRALDTMRFLYEIQNEFYDRYVKAIRDAGYEGEILSSNWQAGRAYSHYYNLHSDWRIGLIDRHNYFGGGSGAKINSVTMLRMPGSGLLSTGMQQAEDRPFMLSEWIHVTPNEWGVEGPAILGAYGMGLNGWDVSYMFQNRDAGKFSERIGKERWDVAAPNVMGVFPAVARQVLRGDVTESNVVVRRNVHIGSLADGKLGFADKVTQQHDVKTFDSDKAPAASLAVARCVVKFTDTHLPTGAFDISKYFRNGAYASSTRQLRWIPGKRKLDGHFTIDSPATKAVVGFAAGQNCKLGDVTIAPQSRFGAIYVTARDAGTTIASADTLLVTAVARARNTNMRVYLDTRILDRGKAPVVMEPITARIEIRRKGSPVVHVLDHAGRKTGRTLPVTNGTFKIDGARDKTCYYLVSYGK
ncbi:MAG: hypothetical protein QGG42_03940 [Phycisphaerae bacterium]|jgi:hypothetical protein|nr:hypothetical protein [Phycisphaerae bacterium]